MPQTILLVDDHRSVRAAVRAVLERAGHAVLEAASGERAVEIAQAHPGPIDMLVADVVMPGMDGFEVARSVRTLRPGARVLFMSGHLGNAHAEDVARKRASFLPKPFAAADLREALEQASTDEEPRPPPEAAVRAAHSSE
jgi:two-component system, cell cycle sensor histidine kinase and response regulator CckA